MPVDFHRPLARARPLRVLVVGDSVGESFGRGLMQWAQATGKATVLDESEPHLRHPVGADAEMVVAARDSMSYEQFISTMREMLGIDW